MIYRVTIQNDSNIDVSTKRATTSKVDVDTRGSLSLEDLQDVNTATRVNNSILIYNASTGKYDHVNPEEILDRADGVADGSLNYGTY